MARLSIRASGWLRTPSAATPVKLDIPWGISESAFASVDADHHYHYRAFGVPQLGLRRGLSKDLVVAPYATALALAVRPGAAVDNLRKLDHLGLVGCYGLWEAADFTPERVPRATHCRWSAPTWRTIRV